MKDSGIEWIGEIPEDWGIIKAKYILVANDGGVWGDDPTGSDNDKIVLRSTEQTVDGLWCINEPARRDLSKISYVKSLIFPNDLLMTKSSGSCAHIGKTTLAGTYFSTHECYYSNFLQRLRVKKSFSPKYIWYTLNSIFTREQFVFLQNSTSGIGNINSENINNIILPLLSLSEQQKIADYLDKKCAAVDRLMENQRLQIEKLKEYKQSLITEAVTKGLDKTVPLKSSDVEWLGKIPQNWKTIKLKYCTYIRARLGWKGLKADEYVEEGYPLLSAFNIINDKLDVNDVNYINQFRYDESPEIKLSVYDILLVKDGAGIGKCAIVEELKTPSTTNGSLAVITTENGLLSKYLYYYFLSKIFQKYIDRLKAGMGVPHLFQADLKEIQIPFASWSEQQQIVDYLDKKCAEIDELISIKQQKIEKLTEYKKSLIYEYVTGKKEVVS